MSTNKTENYQLHAWEPGDDFLLAEMNANFAKLDTAARVVAGSYTGDGAESQFVDLGFTPRLILVAGTTGSMNNTYESYSGLARPEQPVECSKGTILKVEPGGFRVYYIAHTTNTMYPHTNYKGWVFNYLALR